jgi:hypothetical protein
MIEFLQKYFSNNVNVIYISIMVTGLVVGATRYPKLSVSSRIFFLLLFVTPVKEMLGYYFAITYKNNSPVSNLFHLMEFSLFSLAFYYDTYIRAYVILPVSLALFTLVNGLFFGQFFAAQDYKTQLLAALLYIISFYFSLILYFRVVDKEPLHRFPVFWVGLGFTLFSITSIISFGFSEIASVGGKWHTLAFYSMQYSNYLLYLMFIPAFLTHQKRLRDYITTQ